ncbi:MAG: hypothetical protein IKT08_00330 [Bacteroidales bacterium]|nr:hypothetical protein [Bacteroidales bacterium]
MESKSIHVGHMLELEMLRQDKKVAWLAREVNREKSSIYKMFARNSLDVWMLIRISQLLKHDFFKDISTTVFGEQGLD